MSLNDDRTNRTIIRLEAEVFALKTKMAESADWLEELARLTAELRDDLKRFYEPDKGWPPHINKATDLGDYEEVVRGLRGTQTA